ncbi:Oidioi.mRNA.OKI2018_I69.chr2.g4547.t1.cds [Oikopleura dioica]|uniref:Oidioi.mRNA.OKI2018_I69.chr2.g4547.t1.cds n=1 Tax=Oikopleura dioica TaxID=34765 RepID=A0ABN7T4A3_OIKDI|nr:Oidioi.mRNA.OKI2018_I69.chr2.g4547.t1.cds [Oikopleura dioica]
MEERKQEEKDDEKIIERQRLSHVFNKLAEQNGPVEEEEATMNAFFTTWQLRQLVENFGEDPLEPSDVSELVKILDPLGQGRVLVSHAVAVLCGEA